MEGIKQWPLKYGNLVNKLIWQNQSVFEQQQLHMYLRPSALCFALWKMEIKDNFEAW